MRVSQGLGSLRLQKRKRWVCSRSPHHHCRCWSPTANAFEALPSFGGNSSTCTAPQNHVLTACCGILKISSSPLLPFSLGFLPVADEPHAHHRGADVGAACGDRPTYPWRDYLPGIELPGCDGRQICMEYGPSSLSNVGVPWRQMWYIGNNVE